MYNILLYSGIALITSGFLLYIVSIMMMTQYDRKLFLLKEMEKKINQSKNN